MRVQRCLVLDSANGSGFSEFAGVYLYILLKNTKLFRGPNIEPLDHDKYDNNDGDRDGEPAHGGDGQASCTEASRYL